MSIKLFVIVLACVLLLLAACKTPEPPRVSFGWAGAFLIAVVTLLLTGCASMFLPDYGAMSAAQSKAAAGDNKAIGNCVIAPTPWGMARTSWVVVDETGSSNATMSIKGNCDEVSVQTSKPAKVEPVKP